MTAYNKLNDNREKIRKILAGLGKVRYGKNHQLEVGERYNVDTSVPTTLPSPRTSNHGK